jgi:ATP-binding protein involved in chromosome partitioning
VQDPEMKRDLVSHNMIQDNLLRWKGKFYPSHTTPSLPAATTMENEARPSRFCLDGVKEVHIQVKAQVPQDKRLQRTIKVPVKNAIAIGSGKGGVGKSTVAVNLAVSLAKCGASVGLLDADIYGPNIPTMMGIRKVPAGKNNRMVPAEAYGVKVISIGFFVAPDQALIWRGPMLHSAIQQFIGDVEWGELDYLIIDLPPGTGDAPISLAQTIPLSGAVIVTLPQQVSIEDARRGVEMFRKLEIPVLGIIENMSYLELPDGQRMDIFGSGGGERLAEIANVPFLASIPIDPIVRQGGDSGEPVVAAYPESPIAKAFAELANIIAGKVSMAALNSTQDAQDG